MPLATNATQVTKAMKIQKTFLRALTFCSLIYSFSIHANSMNALMSCHKDLAKGFIELEGVLQKHISELINIANTSDLKIKLSATQYGELAQSLNDEKLLSDFGNTVRCIYVLSDDLKSVSTYTPADQTRIKSIYELIENEFSLSQPFLLSSITPNKSLEKQIGQLKRIYFTLNNLLGHFVRTLSVMVSHSKIKDENFESLKEQVELMVNVFKRSSKRIFDDDPQNLGPRILVFLNEVNDYNVQLIRKNGMTGDDAHRAEASYLRALLVDTKETVQQIRENRRLFEFFDDIDTCSFIIKP